jgi:hypothetical protein
MLAQEQSLLHQISVDVPRTHCKLHPWLFSDVRVQDSLTRVLFALATAFPEVSYFQGLNEVPIPFFVCSLREHGPLAAELLAALSDDSLSQVESDVFWSVLYMLEPVYRCTQASAKKIHAIDQTQVKEVAACALIGALIPCANTVGGGNCAAQRPRIVWPFARVACGLYLICISLECHVLDSRIR